MILFVCEGNVCRSALAACLLGAAVSPRHPELRVESAGTLAARAQRMDPATAAIALRNGVDPSDHRSRRLSVEILGQARLVLTATRAVRSAVVQMHPPSVQHTFTIRQVGRILDATTDSLVPISTEMDSPVEELRLFITRHRGMPPGDPTLDDVVDPRGQPGPGPRMGGSADAPRTGWRGHRPRRAAELAGLGEKLLSTKNRMSDNV